jgi:hypothetical protein
MLILPLEWNGDSLTCLDRGVMVDLTSGTVMSNVYFIIRFGCAQFQIGRGWPWVSLVYNAAYQGNPTGKWFAIY